MKTTRRLPVFMAAWLLLLLICTASDLFAGQTIEGIVRAVYDGDTILLATRQENRMKVRLYGIDAPETTKPGQAGQPFSTASKRTLMYKIMGRQVSIEIMDSDSYKRTVAIVRYAGRDINREMVYEGMAWAYRQYLLPPYASAYIDTEQSARNRHKGIWRDPNPTPPWEFRKIVKPKGNKRRH